MGISGLLPFLKSIHQEVNVSQFSKQTVAIDAYCWLHKGAFACADKLALGIETDIYVRYCMKFIYMLLKNDIKPILVFDGSHLPSKRDTEIKRREGREQQRRRAAQLLREGNRSEAREALQRCVDITPHMALALIKTARDAGVDCIVAPYEADAQLAFLAQSGIAQLIITEDSDLLLFGCSKILFKMDASGRGVLIDRADLPRALGKAAQHFTFDKFRYMCILSGCDYLPSLPGVGLATALKILKLAKNPDITAILARLSSYAKKVPNASKEYIQGFVKAERTFLYQLVFDPLTRCLRPLTQYPEGLDTTQLDYAGPYIDNTRAFQIALGNVDIHTKKLIDDFDPDNTDRKTTKWILPHERSIWDPRYRTFDPNNTSTGSSSRSPRKHSPPSALVHSRSDATNLRRASTNAPKLAKVEVKSEVNLMSLYSSSQNPESSYQSDTNEAAGSEETSVQYMDDSQAQQDESNSQEDMLPSNETESSPNKPSVRPEELSPLKMIHESTPPNQTQQEQPKSAPDGTRTKSAPDGTRTKVLNKFSMYHQQPTKRFRLDEFCEVKSRFFSNSTPPVTRKVRGLLEPSPLQSDDKHVSSDTQKSPQKLPEKSVEVKSEKTESPHNNFGSSLFGKSSFTSRPVFNCSPAARSGFKSLSCSPAARTGVKSLQAAEQENDSSKSNGAAPNSMDVPVRRTTTKGPRKASTVTSTARQTSLLDFHKKFAYNK